MGPTSSSNFTNKEGNAVDATDSAEFVVVVNAARQRALWPAWKQIPCDWNSERQGDRSTCLAWIEDITAREAADT